MLSPKMNLISHFCTSLDFKHTDLWSPLIPLVGQMIHICACRLFCMKFNSEELFLMYGVFLAAMAPKWTYFPIPLQYLKYERFISLVTSQPEFSCWWATLHTILGLDLYGRRSDVWEFRIFSCSGLPELWLNWMFDGLTESYFSAVSSTGIKV